MTGAVTSTEGMGRAGRLQASAGCAGEVLNTAPKQRELTRALGTDIAPSPGQRAVAITCLHRAVCSVAH